MERNQPWGERGMVEGEGGRKGNIARLTRLRLKLEKERGREKEGELEGVDTTQDS